MEEECGIGASLRCIHQYSSPTQLSILCQMGAIVIAKPDPYQTQIPNWGQTFDLIGECGFMRVWEALIWWPYTGP